MVSEAGPRGKPAAKDDRDEDCASGSIDRKQPFSCGGTERVVSWITEEFVRQGHEVTLFASGNAGMSARLVPCGRRVLRLDAEVAAA